MLISAEWDMKRCSSAFVPIVWPTNWNKKHEMSIWKPFEFPIEVKCLSCCRNDASRLSWIELASFETIWYNLQLPSARIKIWIQWNYGANQFCAIHSHTKQGTVCKSQQLMMVSTDNRIASPSIPFSSDAIIFVVQWINLIDSPHPISEEKSFAAINCKRKNCKTSKYKHKSQAPGFIFNFSAHNLVCVLLYIGSTWLAASICN